VEALIDRRPQETDRSPSFRGSSAQGRNRTADTGIFKPAPGVAAAPNTRPAAELLPDPAAARSRLKLLYLSCGKQDGLINVSQSMHRDLRDRSLPHVWNVDEHAHDRESWSENLYHFSQRIFR